MSFEIAATGSKDEVVAQLRQHRADPGSFVAKLRALLADSIEAETPFAVRKGHRWAYHVALFGHHQAGDTGAYPISLSGSVTAQQVPDTSPAPAVQATAGAGELTAGP